jgi:hypothetical protein
LVTLWFGLVVQGSAWRLSGLAWWSRGRLGDPLVWPGDPEVSLVTLWFGLVVQGSAWRLSGLAWWSRGRLGDPLVWPGDPEVSLVTIWFGLVVQGSAWRLSGLAWWSRGRQPSPKKVFFHAGFSLIMVNVVFCQLEKVKFVATALGKLPFTSPSPERGYGLRVVRHPVMV